MPHKVIPTSAELVMQSLSLRRNQENKLFGSDKEAPAYWRMSDLAILYPDYFNMQNLVTPNTIREINNTIREAIPEFRDLAEQPVHILNTKETYNIYLKDTNQIKTIKNGLNQQLTNIACEYLFRNCPGKTLEQAYFLYPEKKPGEIQIAAQELQFERVRDQIAKTSNLLAAIINRAYGSHKGSFSEIWSSIWKVLYGVRNMDELRARYNIKTSPIDYMSTQTLVFINAMLQEVVLKFSKQLYYNIEEVKDSAMTMAGFARARFFRYGSKPEDQLTGKSSYSRIEKIRHDRKKFWEKYYTISLQQR